MPFDKEKAKQNIQGILEKINNETDLTQLKEYNKLFKKEISVFKRAWVATWLFMYYDKRETPNQKSANSTRIADTPRIFNNQRAAEGEDSEARKPFSPVEVTLPEEESKMLFISIGKNRRLFPREVITLIMTKCSVPREDIGIIRILDNYSFVQVRDVKADEIIATLTGHKFRGRTLTVNYAKPKNAETEASK